MILPNRCRDGDLQHRGEKRDTPRQAQKHAANIFHHDPIHFSENG